MEWIFTDIDKSLPPRDTRVKVRPAMDHVWSDEYTYVNLRKKEYWAKLIHVEEPLDDLEMHQKQLENDYWGRVTASKIYVMKYLWLMVGTTLN